jgi:hypothetical protein
MDTRMGRAVSFYLQVTTSDPTSALGVWQVDVVEAKRIDVTDSPPGRHRAEPGKDALTTLKTRFSADVVTFHELELNPGEYYPGMARPVAGESPGRNQDRSDKAIHSRASFSGQLHALIQQFEQICRVVQPIEPNFRTFGHEIRNVLILACTEVEAQWKGILESHDMDAENTKDYVKLASPMKLSEYRVEFPYYPWISAIRPFANWHSGTKTPTKDLPWYDAYNNVKHDRESNFNRASLGHTFEALTGFFVMLCAQYGWDFALSGDAASRAFFRLRDNPQWSFSEYYVPPYGDKLRPRKYKFPA